MKILTKIFIFNLLVSGINVKGQIATFNCNQTPRKDSALATILGPNVVKAILRTNGNTTGHPFTGSLGATLIKDITTTKDTTKKVEFSVAPTAGYQTNPTTLTFSLLPSSGGPTKVDLLVYSGGNWSKQDSVVTGIVANGSTTTNITLNFATGVPISRFKVVLHAGSPTGGSGTMDNFVLNGSVVCITVTGATASSNSPVAVGGTINLSSSATTGGLNYLWSGPNGFTSSIQNPTIASATVNMSGTYTVTVSSAGLCSATATTAVTVTNPCPNSLTLVSTADDITSGTVVKEAAASGGKIIASNKITGGNVIYKAPVIEFGPGFEVNSSTKGVFKTESGGCN